MNQAETLLTLAAVLGGYTLANDPHVSGPPAMLVTGLIIGNNGRAEALSDATRHHVDLFWAITRRSDPSARNAPRFADRAAGSAR